MADLVTVAIPVLNGGGLFGEVLESLNAQRVDRKVEVLVADSGSTDGSPQLARHQGAEVIEIPPGHFSHGATRNLLVRRAAGSHVALITQDAVPADDRWLARLLEGFELARDVGLVFGPYRPRPEASLMVRRELDEWFDSLAPRGQGPSGSNGRRRASPALLHRRERLHRSVGVGTRALPGGRLCGGPAYCPGHARRGVREGL